MSTTTSASRSRSRNCTIRSVPPAKTRALPLPLANKAAASANVAGAAYSKFFKLLSPGSHEHEITTGQEQQYTKSFLKHNEATLRHQEMHAVDGPGFGHRAPQA